jgi:hypothetical protein
MRKMQEFTAAIEESNFECKLLIDMDDVMMLQQSRDDEGVEDGTILIFSNGLEAYVLEGYKECKKRWLSYKIFENFDLLGKN